MRFIARLIWFVVAGIWLMLGYLQSVILGSRLIVTIPYWIVTPRRT
jgi:uncharacterized membrane protein YccF (DUF307 family)